MMKRHPEQVAVGEFLKELKLLVSRQGLYLVPREVNMKALAKMGLTRANLKDEILSLSVADYCEGPSRDRNQPGFLWVFGKQVMCHDVYIKLKISDVKGSGKKTAKCISFHEADFPMSFPLKNKGRSE